MAARKKGAKAGFTDEEKEAMRERARELKAGKADGEADLRAKLGEMPDADRVLGERIHAIVRENAPDLQPKTWYGMPAWARDGKVVCFFQAAARFKSRYATFGFADAANLDDGGMWATSFAVREIDEAKIAALVRRAVR